MTGRIQISFFEGINTSHPGWKDTQSILARAFGMSYPLKTMTIGELKRQLAPCPDDYEIIFGCPELEFFRLKKRGDTLIQMEFNQMISKDEKGKWSVDDPADMRKAPVGKSNVSDVV